jgi:hypothetical protein
VSGKRSRDKGARGELRVRDLYRSSGFECRRNFGSGAQGGGDLIGGDMPVVPEVKNTERVTLWPWVEQAQSGIRPPFREDEWCLHVTGNNRPRVVVVDEGLFMRLLEDQRSLHHAIRTGDA